MPHPGSPTHTGLRDRHTFYLPHRLLALFIREGVERLQLVHARAPIDLCKVRRRHAERGAHERFQDGVRSDRMGTLVPGVWDGLAARLLRDQGDERRRRVVAIAVRLGGDGGVGV